MNNDDVTKRMIQMVNQNNDYFQIAEYMIKRFNLEIDNNEAKKIAEHLVKNRGFKKEDILSGKADQDIYLNIRSYIIRSNSVRKKDEPYVETKLETIKKHFNRKTVSLMLAILLGISAASAIGGPIIDECREDKEITQTIGMMATEVGSEDYEYKKSIVSQNTYHVPGQFDAEGHPIKAYYNDKIAEDIIQVCTQNPEMFDLCMYNVYFDMSYNRLENMDSVLKYLQRYLKDETALSVIYEKIDDCSVFFDYLVRRGFLNPNDKDYYIVLEDIEKYKELKDDSSIKVPFNALSEESQERLQNLIETYSQNKDNLYENYKNSVESLDGENIGSR